LYIVTVQCIILIVIKTFKNKQLKKFFLQSNPSGLNPDHIMRIRRLLSALHSATSLDVLKQHRNYKLHPLKGDLKDFWAITVSGNYRITFRFTDNNVYDVDYIDYH
jgi:toxin HigB-1